FGAETRPEGRSKCVVTWLQRALLQPFLEDEKDGRAGEVADVTEDVPGWLRLTLRKAKLDFDVSEQARTTRMQTPALYVFALPAVAHQEAVTQVTNLSANEFRNIFGEEDVKSGVAQIEAHGVERIGKSVSFGYQDSWPACTGRGCH